MASGLLDEEIRQGIVDVMRRLYIRGLVTSLGGNVSSRSSDKKRFWITCSGVDKYRITVEDLSLIDIGSGEVVAGGRPSSEYLTHLAIYRAREDIESIVHSHNPYTLVLVEALVRHRHLRDLMRQFYEVETMLGGVEVVERIPPGSRELASAVARVFSERRDVGAVVLRDHGVVAVGRSLVEALNRAEVLEDISRVVVTRLLLGL